MTNRENIYFVILANSHTQAEAIAEAHRLCGDGPLDYVEVRQCGTRDLIANVYPDGTISTPKRPS